MVLLDHLWDDVVAGTQPERGLKHLKKDFAKPLNVKDTGGEGSSISKYARSLSMPASPGTPPTTSGAQNALSPVAGRRDNVWRSVFHPGSNLATKGVGADYFDRPQPNSPTALQWGHKEQTPSLKSVHVLIILGLYIGYLCFLISYEELELGLP